MDLNPCSVIDLVMKLSDRSLQVHAKTWVRDSHGLFDYESQHIETNVFETRASSLLTRAGDQVRLTAQASSDTAQNATPSLLSLVRKDGNSYSDGFVLTPTSEDLWLVVRYLETPQPGLALTKDHVIKLGRVKYRVKEVQDGTEDRPGTGSDTETSEGEMEAEEIPEEREETTCRICYDRQRDKDDPLLSHCKCDGSVKYIHLMCLKQWLRSKVTIRSNENSTTYHWKFLECEICKTELPLTLKFKGTSLNLFDFEKPQAPYIVLEAVPSDRSANKAMHVISMTNGKHSIRLGRGHDSDVRINDISVSRCHAMIKFEAGQFVIEDNSSKFGTLVKVTEPIVVPRDGKITMQAGRTLLQIEEHAENGKLRSNDIREVHASELRS